MPTALGLTMLVSAVVLVAAFGALRQVRRRRERQLRDELRDRVTALGADVRRQIESRRGELVDATENGEPGDRIALGSELRHVQRAVQDFKVARGAGQWEQALQAGERLQQQARQLLDSLDRVVAAARAASDQRSEAERELAALRSQLEDHRRAGAGELASDAIAALDELEAALARPSDGQHGRLDAYVCAAGLALAQLEATIADLADTIAEIPTHLADFDGLVDDVRGACALGVDVEYATWLRSELDADLQLLEVARGAGAEAAELYAQGQLAAAHQQASVVTELTRRLTILAIHADLLRATGDPVPAS